MKKLLSLSIMKRVLLYILLYFFAISCTVSTGPAPYNGTTGDSVIYDFTLENLEGTFINLQTQLSNGNAVLLDFWALWCGPCISSMPDTQMYFETYSNTNLKVYAVNIESASKKAVIIDFMTTNNYTFPVLLDGGSTVSRFGVNTIPRYILFNTDGELVFNAHPNLLTTQDILDSL
jgi:thiol-disulfide isomerase/thioredoxin